MRSLGWGRWLICALAVLWSPSCARPQRATAPLNVLLVTVDTFRADRLGIGAAPSLDRLAETSVRFTAARAAVPLTLPSHATIHTGLLPPVHGVRVNGLELADNHATVATLLKRAGYQTAAFVGAFVLDRRFGLARGFDAYDDQIPRDPRATDRLEAERPAAAVVDRALAWLDQHVPAQAAASAEPAPFFVWVHLYDPHAPYMPPPEFRARARSAYDGEIVYVDSQIARLMEWMRARRLIDRSMIVVTGDHGEGLGDHGERTHGMLLYDSTLRVPLIVTAPGRGAARRDDPVTLADIAPTILRAAGLAPPAAMNGRDLLAGAVDSPNDVYSESEYPRVAGWSPLQALTDGRWKVVRSDAASELFDVRSDPAETHDLAHAEPALAAAMSRTIDRFYSRGTATTERVVSLDAQERLRALGYVGSSAQPPRNSTAPNPAVVIAAWNAFEDALASLNEKRPEAAAALKELALKNPNAGVFHTTYARALNETGQPDRALAVYRAAAKRWPTDAMILHDLAVAARDTAARRGGADAAALRTEAARADEAAVALAPNNALAHNALGLMAIEDNRPQAAAAAFARAAAIDPNNASYWANLGNARRTLGDVAGAEQAYRRALDVDPHAADAANGLGVLLVEAQRATEAVAWLERALAAAPDFVEARLNLGIALQQSGNAGRAIEEYRRVVAAPARHKRERDAAAALLHSLGAGR